MSAPKPAGPPGPPFGDLFYGLRDAGIKVGLSEWMALMEALSSGLIGPSLDDLYAVGRAVLIKDESDFDTWDQVFAHVFADGALPRAAIEAVLAWLDDPRPPPGLDDAARAELEALDFDELRRTFEERLAEQTERHDGGNRWIGTGGTSPFGHSGANPAGVRVGGSGGSRSAVQVALQRRFRDYRNDRVLDTRAFAVALKKLRRLARAGEPELDIDASIDATCRRAGELHLELVPPRRNEARVLLLMDTGGSMDPYARLVDTLFSAASNLGHWKAFKALFFHNCPYEKLWVSMWGGEEVATGAVLRELPPETYLIVVGDASMAPSELVSRFGAIDWSTQNNTPGIVWLHRLRSRFQRAAWLNPMPPRWWGGWSCQAIGGLFDMFPLTVDGIDDAIDHLLRGRSAPPPDLPAEFSKRRG